MSRSEITKCPPLAVKLKTTAHQDWNLHCDNDPSSLCDDNTWFFVLRNANKERSYHLEHFATGKMLWMPADSCIRLEYDSVNMQWKEDE